MENNGSEKNEVRDKEQIWKDLLEIIDRQLEINNQLREIVEPFAGASSKKKQAVLTEEMANKAKEIFVELEALQAQERPIYHNLFGDMN